MDATRTSMATVPRAGEPARDPTELSDDDLEHVVGGLTRTWTDGVVPAGAVGGLREVGPSALPA
jgi:hypothetical protein